MHQTVTVQEGTFCQEAEGLMVTATVQTCLGDSTIL